MWDILDTGVSNAEQNMRLDEELLLSLGSRSTPLLHFYEWSAPSLTYGYFLNPASLLDIKRLKNRGFDYARRPTGGGVVFHTWDFAFSALVPASHPMFSPNTLENYAFINNIVLKAVKKFLKEQQDPLITKEDMIAWDASCSHFCMARPTKYDLLLEGKKIAGAAQRKTKQGFLHQGTIALSRPSVDLLNEFLLPGTQVAEAMVAHTYALLGREAPRTELTRERTKLKEILKKTFTYDTAAS